jgi:thiol peroxidase
MASVTFKAKSVNTCGSLPPVGSRAPAFVLTDVKMADSSLSDYAGKKKILNIVPSLDTPTCQVSHGLLMKKLLHWIIPWYW